MRFAFSCRDMSSAERCCSHWVEYILLRMEKVGLNLQSVDTILTTSVILAYEIEGLKASLEVSLFFP